MRCGDATDDGVRNGHLDLPVIIGTFALLLALLAAALLREVW